ncbi:MAG TPA: response regulator [Terracidiphilus sp.]|nr:response regulator [Terracidiphilus sp.]
MANSGYRPTILVVDDVAVIAETLAKILHKSGYDVVTAYDGEDAIQAALLRPPELVISDIMLPGMNGIELGITIRRIFPDCKVILSSGKPQSEGLLAAALSAGNHFIFLQKPVPPDVLLAHVSQSLKSLMASA